MYQFDAVVCVVIGVVAAVVGGVFCVGRKKTKKKLKEFCRSHQKCFVSIERQTSTSVVWRKEKNDNFCICVLLLFGGGCRF